MNDKFRARVWMGAGIFALGVGAALATGAGTANADSTGTGHSGVAHHQKRTAGPTASSRSAKPKNRTVVAGARANVTADTALSDQDKAIAEQDKAIDAQKTDFAQDFRHVVTTTNFSVLPPEVNSTRIYTGTGSAALINAASAWNGLADDLNAAAQRVDGVVKVFNGAPGPVGGALAAAATPYVGWLSAAATQAQNAATQASAAGAAFETAFVGNVPPSAIDANRAQLAQLAAVNIFSGNIPAIVATEALYAEMWAQDVAAMINAAYKP